MPSRRRSSRSAIRNHQVNVLTEAHQLGLFTDASLAAACAQVGEDIDRTSLVKMRSGDRPAPLGLLPILLEHVDDPAAVLDVLARPHGLRVVADADVATDERGLAVRALELTEKVGAVCSRVRAALYDGRTDAEELETISEGAGDLRRLAAELEALTSPRSARRSA